MNAYPVISTVKRPSGSDRRIAFWNLKAEFGRDPSASLRKTGFLETK